MKKVKFLQDYQCKKAGELAELHNITADNLVALGVAQYFDETTDEQQEGLEIENKETKKKK